MIRRRALLAGGLVLAPALVAAQAPVRRRIVLLRWDTEATSGEAVARFIARLGELG